MAEETDRSPGGAGDFFQSTPDATDFMTQRDAVVDAADILGITNETLAAIIAGNARLEQALSNQEAALGEIESRVGELCDQQSEAGVVGAFPVDMSHTVPADTDGTDNNTVERTPREDGPSRIIGITLGWPDGANSAVGVQLRTDDGLKLVPRNPEDDYIAFNDFTETFPLDYTLTTGESIVAQTVNFDSSNGHFVNIVPHISEDDGVGPTEEEEDDDGSQ